MAITEKSIPFNYASAHEDLFYVVLSDNIAQPNFKYVFDIYIDAVLVSRLKIVPEPLYSLGICNIGQVVRSYLSNFYFKGHAETWKSVLTDGYFLKSVTVKYGEEYGTPVTLFTNLTLSTAQDYYNYYNDVIFRDNASTLTNFIDTFLTSGPTTRTVTLGDNLYVYFWNDSGASRTLTIRTYDSTGTIINTQADATLSTNVLVSLNVGPKAINAAYAGLIDSVVKFYTIQVGTLLLTFNVDCFPKYQHYRVVFMNQVGGFDSVPFRLKSASSVEADRKSFGKRNYRYDNTGTIFYQEQITDAAVIRGNSATYSTVFKRKYTLSTDYLTDAEFTWLQQLMLSPLVYLEYRDGAGNSFHYPIKIATDTYQLKTKRNDKLNAFSVDVELLTNLNTQFS